MFTLKLQACFISCDIPFPTLSLSLTLTLTIDIEFEFNRTKIQELKTQQTTPLQQVSVSILALQSTGTLLRQTSVAILPILLATTLSQAFGSILALQSTRSVLTQASAAILATWNTTTSILQASGCIFSLQRRGRLLSRAQYQININVNVRERERVKKGLPQLVKPACYLSVNIYKEVQGFLVNCNVKKSAANKRRPPITGEIS